MIEIKDLEKKPYQVIPFSVPKAQIHDAMDSFFEFLTLPDSIKNHMDLRICHSHRRGDLGFKHRDPEGGIYNDSKDFFHYHPALESHYAQFIEQNDVVKRFIKNASAIWEVVYKTIKDIMTHFDKDYPGTLSKIFDSDEPHIMLRFLKYDYPKSGKYLAKPHFDAGSFTLAIAESNPGLRIGTNPDDLHPVHHCENQAIFMVSSNFRKILDADQIKAGWHDVIQLDEAEIGKSFSRWAMVAFIEGHSVEALPRSETHKFYVPEVAY